MSIQSQFMKCSLGLTKSRTSPSSAPNGPIGTISLGSEGGVAGAGKYKFDWHKTLIYEIESSIPDCSSA